MLKKLFRHEWKDTWVVGTVCAIVVVALTIIGMLLFSMDIWSASASRGDRAMALTQSMVAIYFMLFVWGVIGAVCVIKYYFFYRYYKNLFTDHGYLMHTLPVKSTELINAKLFVTIIWQYISSALVTFAVVGLMLSALGNATELTFHDFAKAINEIMRQMDWEAVVRALPTIVSAVVYMLLAPVFGTLLMYAAIGVGQLNKKHKLLVSVLILLGFNMAIQTIAQLMAMPLNLGMWDRLPSLTTVNIISVVLLLVYIGATVGLYFANKYFVEKKLNLE